MNFRQTAILLGAVLVVGVVLLIFMWTSDDDKKPKTDALTEELAGLEPTDIDSVEIERAGTKLKMVRTSGGGKDKKPAVWEIVEPYKAAADSATVVAVAAALMQAKPVAHNELTSNPATHKLDPPGLKITLHGIKVTTEEGKEPVKLEGTSTVSLGNVSLGGSKGVVFVTTSKQTRPMAVPRGSIEAVFREQKGGVEASEIAKWVNDFRLKSVFPSDNRVPGEDIVFMKLSLPNKGKELALTRSASGEWTFNSPAGWGIADAEGDQAPGNPNAFTGVNPLVRALANLSAVSTADFLEANDAQKKDYGLSADYPDLVRAELKTREGQTAVVFLGKTEGGPKIPEAAPKMPHLPPPTGGKVYVSVEGQPGVIKAGTRDLSGLVPIISDPDPLRDRDLLRVERGKQVDGLDIIIAGQTPDKPTKLRRLGMGNWRLYGGPNDPQEAYQMPVNPIVDVLTAHRVVKSFPAPNPENFKSISATIYVWVDGFNPPPQTAPNADPVKKSEPVKIELGRKDGDTIYVRRTVPGGAVSELALPAAVKVGGGTETRDVLATVARSRLDLLNPAIPTFSSTSAAKLTVTGLNNYTLEKDEKPTGSVAEPLWRFTSPEPKGRVADPSNMDALLTLLGTTQSVARYVDEQPAPEKLAAEYGLTPNPRLKVVVGFKGEGMAKAEERVYEFGKDSPDANFVYARVAGKSAVFTLGRLVFDKLVSPDLRDRTLFRFDSAKVVAIDLIGWKNLGLGEQKLRFEKGKEGNWSGTVAATKAPFEKLDGTKVEQFLREFLIMRAETFIADPTQLPKYGFGDTNSLIVFLTMEDKSQFSVNLGAPTEGAGDQYYVYTPSLPPGSPFCTVKTGGLKPFKEGPKAFQKP